MKCVKCGSTENVKNSVCGRCAIVDMNIPDYYMQCPKCKKLVRKEECTVCHIEPVKVLV